MSRLDAAADAVAEGASIVDAAAAHNVSPEGVQRRISERERRAQRKPGSKRSAAAQRRAHEQEQRAREAWRMCQDGADEYEIAARLGVTRARARSAIALGRDIMRAAARLADEGEAEAMAQGYRREMARLRAVAEGAEEDAAALAQEGAWAEASRARGVARAAWDSAIRARAKLMELRGVGAVLPASDAERDAVLAEAIRLAAERGKRERGEA